MQSIKLESLLDYALYYVSKGWAVFPLSPRSKVPLWGSNGLLDATTDTEKVEAWWKENPEYNIGIATGEKSGFVVMDVDPRNGGNETLYEKVIEHGSLPGTIQFRTGGGGRHFLFRYPGYKVKSTNIFPGLDSKGDGGYIVAPPSVHESGRLYEAITLDIVLAEIPDWWSKKVKAPPEKKGARRVIPSSFAIERYLEGEMIREGGRDEQLFICACKMRAEGLEQDQIYTALSEVNTIRCSPPLKEKDILRISKSASKYEPGFIDDDDIDAPVPDLNIPAGYAIKKSGIYFTGPKDTKKIFPIPLAITRRLINVDTGNEKIEIQFYRNNKWIPIIIPRSTAFNNSKIIDLSDKGLPVSSSNVKDCVRYLTAFEVANLEMKQEKCVSRLGWVGTDKFVPGCDEGIYLDAPQEYTKGYVCSGSVSDWVENVQTILDFDIARFMLASSFAAPLLKLLKKRSFVVYVYGDSRGGKTASVKTALSVWGDPVSTMLQFDSTPNAIVAQAAFINNLPVGIDERQTLKNQDVAEQLIYRLANGQPKRKLNKDSTPQNSSTWQTITITTGEDSLTTDSTREGVYSRSIELSGVPIPDPKIASKMHTHSEEIYGVAGPLFIQHILSTDNLKEEFVEIESFLEDSCPDNIESHVGSVAIIILADMYMHHLFFKDRSNDSLELGKRILGMLQSKEEGNYATRAYELIVSWVSTRRNSFINRNGNLLEEKAKADSLKEIYGWIDEEFVYFHKTVFKKMIDELGLNDKSVKQQLGRNGLILTEGAGKGNRTFEVKKTNPITNKRERVVVIHLGEKG